MNCHFIICLLTTSKLPESLIVDFEVLIVTFSKNLLTKLLISCLQRRFAVRLVY